MQAARKESSNTPGFISNPLHQSKLDVIKEETEEGLSATPGGYFRWKDATSDQD